MAARLRSQTANEPGKEFILTDIVLPTDSATAFDPVGGGEAAILGVGAIAPTAVTVASGALVSAAGLASGAVEGVVGGGGAISAAASVGDIVVVSGSTSGGLTFDISFDQAPGALDYLPKPADADAVERALLAQEGATPEPPEDPMSADRVRWEHIQRIFELCERNVSETARRLKMHRRTLQRILSKHAPRN